MNKTLLIMVAILSSVAIFTIVSIAIAVIKGFRAGEAFVEVKIARMIQFTIRLSNISKEKSTGKKNSNRKPMNSKDTK